MIPIAERIKAPLRPMVHALRRVWRRRELAKTLPPVTRATLVQQLDVLDLPDQPVLLVHTSLKQLGFVEGGAEGVVDALVEAIVTRRGGTLVLPTFSIEGSMLNSLAAGAVFDVRATPSNLGAIPEAFRRRPGVRRSIHPTHSFAALGPRADWIVAEHHRCGSSFGEGSPMMRAKEADARLCGLGTSLGNVTFYHCLEDAEPDFPISVYAQSGPYPAPCIGWDGETHALLLPAHDTTVSRTRIDHRESTAIRAFVQAELERHAGLGWFAIGHGRGWMVPMRAMYEHCRALMRAGITIYSTADDLARLGRTAAAQREA
jgi:aminoglycoside N3'-acetyltransferase